MRKKVLDLFFIELFSFAELVFEEGGDFSDLYFLAVDIEFFEYFHGVGNYIVFHGFLNELVLKQSFDALDLL